MKITKIIAVLICIFILTSCATKRLWENPSYDEVVESHLITKEGGKIAIIGKDYHYIVTATKELREILLSNKTKYSNPLFHSFKVDKNNRITGKYYALDYSSEKEKNIPSVKKVKNTQKKDQHKEVVKYPRIEGAIEGSRYIAKKTIKSNYKFKNPYYLTIEEEPSALGKVGKILATPITVAADGALVLGGIALIFVILHSSTYPYPYY
jgi:hypothetical protein